tara:strand:+ start:2780 stop:3067 length:288 start_codon:yes stop_codon:yes gene_type:complete
MHPCECDKDDDEEGEEEGSDMEDNKPLDSVGKRSSTGRPNKSIGPSMRQQKRMPVLMKPLPSGEMRVALFKRDTVFPGYWLCCQTPEEGRIELVR